MVARIGSGDEVPLVELVYEYQPALLRLALAFVDDRAVAAEVVQETWTAIVQQISRFEGQCRIKAWIFGMLIKRARLRAIRETPSLPLSALQPLDSDCNSDVMRWLRHAVQGLPIDLRLLMMLRDVEGLDSVEVRQLLGMREDIQEARLHCARSALRRALHKHPGSYANW